MLPPQRGADDVAGPAPSDAFAGKEAEWAAAVGAAADPAAADPAIGEQAAGDATAAAAAAEGMPPPEVGGDGEWAAAVAAAAKRAAAATEGDAPVPDQVCPQQMLQWTIIASATARCACPEA